MDEGEEYYIVSRLYIISFSATLSSLYVWKSMMYFKL